MQILILTVIILVIWIFEYFRHYSNVKQIPIRIHVNGTRGKSSVTRLIAAGLRAGGIKTIAKTTGTLPRVILEDGTEASIERLAGANIIEQKYVFRFAAKRKPQAIVIECMAVNPEYQWVTERKFVQSTISVITNARPDHLDLMGPTIDDVTKSLCNTIPNKGICFTSEEKQLKIMQKTAKKRHSIVKQADKNTVTREMLDGFSYIEHADNIALALEVCEHVGVPREVAIKGMHKATPDPGALTKDIVNDRNKKIIFYNVFAANDPESTVFIWKTCTNHLDAKIQKIIILNGRADRYFRSIQLADATKDLNFDALLLTGEKTDTLYEYCLSIGIQKSKVHDIGEIPPEDLYKIIHDMVVTEAHVFGIGNIAGQHKYGNQIVHFFKNKSKGGK